MINKLLKNPLYKFLVWLLFGIVVCFWGITHTLAWTDKTIYSDSSRTQSNKYLYGSNPNGGIGTASINTNVSGASYGFSFWTNEPVVLNKTYTLKINFMGDDLYNTFSSNFVTVATCYSSTCNDNTIISIEKSSNSGRSTWLKINFNPSSTGDYLFVGLSSDSTPLTAIAGPAAFGISSVQIEATNESQNIIDNQTNNANNIINNQNNNTQDIMDNQDQNTQDIINNQNSNNQALLEDNKKNFQTCRDSYNLYNNNIPSSITQARCSISYSNGSIIVNATGSDCYFGEVRASGSSYVSALGQLIEVKPNTSYTFKSSNSLFKKNFITYYNSSNVSTGFYQFNTSSFTFTTSDDTKYISVRVGSNSCVSGSTYNLNVMLNEGSTSFDYEPYGEEICVNKLDEQNNNLNNINDSINDDNVDSSSWANFFNNFTTNTFGLTSIITAPLNLIQSLTNTSCSDLQLPLPYLNNKYLTLPCMSSIYSQYFGSFFTLYQTITYGIIAYWVCVRLFNLVKDFKNPEHDEIEVVDL